MNYLYHCRTCGDTVSRSYLGSDLGCPGAEGVACPETEPMPYRGVTFLEPTWPLGPSRKAVATVVPIRTHVPNLGVLKFWPLRHTLTLTPSADLEGVRVVVQERPNGIDAVLTYGASATLVDLVETIDGHPLLKGKFVVKIGVDDP
jgi:hypothetical protein